MSENKYKSPCKCDECVKKYSKKQRELLAKVMVKTSMTLIGDFSHCIACKFLFETIDHSKLHLCNRCSHLYEGKLGIDKDECGCWKEKQLYYFYHTIKTYSMGVCAYCKSKNIEYEKGVDNSVKFLLDDNKAFFIMICKECGRKSREYYNIEFIITEGI